MSTVLILVEGQTEETFVREVLHPHLAGRGIYPIAKLATTKRVKSGPDFKGGIVSYGKFKNDVLRLLGDTSAALVTTMVDFYGLPTDFPGRRSMPASSCYDQVAYLEQEICKDIGHPRFLPYLALHEFEAMLFVAPEKIAQAFPAANKGGELTAIKQQFGSPEEIDDNPQTAPSRRLEILFPGYEKPLHGPLVILEIGVEQIRIECPHFNNWLVELEKLGEGRG
jgi:hypothetical protein